MCLWKNWWVACASIATSIAMVSASTWASEADPTAAAVPGDGSSSVEVVVPQGDSDEPAAAASASPDEPASSPEPTSDRPAELAAPGPEGIAEVSDESPRALPADSAATPAQAARPTAETPSDPPGTVAEPPLEPVPDPRSSGIVPAETASFNGITPGVSTLDELQEAWGPPKEIANRNAQLMHLYSVEPFERVEVSFVKDRVSAIVIRLDRAFPADLVAEKLELSDVQPVLVSDELGHVLGESFPERGVLFAFEPSETPGTASMKVLQIILEPVGAEAFVLRAETHMDRQPDRSLRDLEQAIELDPENARAHWLRARLLAVGGDSQAALDACAEAIRRSPEDAQYRLTRAQILGRLERFEEAIAEAEQALANSTSRPHVKAQVVCLLGDLFSSQPEPDYRRAIQYHMEAVKTADPLAASRHPAVRIAAKEVLIDAHLGAGHDIAWGSWEGKEKAVPRWLDQAASVAEDLADSEGVSVEPQFRVAARALAALVGLRGKLEPDRWAEETLRVGQQLVAATPDSPQKDRLRWDLGMALYDAVQICQMRGDHEKALTYGKRAIAYLEPGATSEQAGLADPYLLGRLYFRMGAIHAVGKQDHAAAIYWFEKAVPVFQESVDHLAQTEFGRLGETYVSMGVSFWENQQLDRAVRLTQRGVELMEQAVRGGAMQRSALEVPYTNLATMARHLGKSDEADQYLLEAKRLKQATLR